MPSYKKCTPQKENRKPLSNTQQASTKADLFLSANKQNSLPEGFGEEMLSLPMLEVMPWNSVVVTPLKKQPELMMSPSPVKKDLFHQLLGTETKNTSPFNTCTGSAAIMEEDDFDYPEESLENDSNL